MKRHSSGFVIGIIAAIILGFGVFAGIALALRSSTALGYEPQVLQAQKTGPGTATLNISTFPDSNVCHAGEGEPQINWVTYCSSKDASQGTTWEVPPNTLVTVVINQYDSASGLINDYFSQVRGTVGGVAMYNGRPMTKINPDDAAHTFTLQTTPDSTNPLFVSVPLLGVADDAPNAVTIAGNPYPKPNVITFQFRTGSADTYVWHCYVPCGNDRYPPYGFSGPMATTGYMAGTITVANY
jgi:hypothetical protein